MTSNKLFAAAIAVMLTVLAPLAGCKSGGSPGSVQAGPYGSSAATLANHLKQQADTPWTALSVPVSLKVSDSGLPTVSGTMTMVRDSEIRITLRLLGFEVGAARVTADSVYAYVKVQRIYMAESIADIMGGFPATTGNLQSLLLGRLFTLGSASPSLKGAGIAVPTTAMPTPSPPQA